MNGLEQLLPIVLLAVAFWFLLIRPQRRRQQELMATQRSIDVGDEVMIGAGIFGQVAEIDEETLVLEVAPGVRVKVARGAVVRVLPSETAAAEEPPAGPPTDVEQ